MHKGREAPRNCERILVKIRERRSHISISVKEPPEDIRNTIEQLVEEREHDGGASIAGILNWEKDG